MNNLDYKSLTIEELQHVFSGVDFLLKPMRHQYVSLAFAIDRDRVAFLHDVGTGKTLCALYTLQLWNCRRILVVCPSSAFGSWRRDLKNNTNFSYSFLTGSGKNRKQALEEKKDVYIINYEGLKTLYSKLSKIKGEGWKILPDSFIHNFDCIVLDEAHKVKSYDALQSKICFELSRRAEYAIGLTGTLIDRSYLELFNVYRVLDLGKSLGANFFAYRYHYFDKEVCGSKFGRKKWIEWNLKPGCEEEILNRISGMSISFDREECFDLPPVQKIFKWISPSKQFLQVQEDIVDNKSSCSLSKELIGSKIKTKAHILRELPSGFFYCGRDKKVVSLNKNPKVEALLDLLEDSSSKIIVFYWYTEERNIIERALTKEKISFCSAFGGQNTSDREGEIYRFQNDKNVRVLVSQVTVASEGFDAFAANVVVFFRPLSSPKMIKQCIGRARRKGQKQKVLVVTFVMEDSIEERVIVNRSERFNLVREAEDFIKNFHKGLEVDEV